MKTEFIDLGDDWEYTYCTMPYEHVYFLEANRIGFYGDTVIEDGNLEPDDYFDVFVGYVVAEEYAAEIFSSKALPFAKRWRGLYIFEEKFKTIAEFELLKEHISIYKEFYLYEKLAELQEYGRLEVPEYFGEFPAPEKAEFGNVTLYKYCDNGIYWVQINGKLCLAVRASILDMVSRACVEAASVYDGYAFFKGNACAVALHALNHIKALSKSIASHERLIATLWQEFPEYVKKINDSAHSKKSMIPMVKSEAGNFLLPIKIIDEIDE